MGNIVLLDELTINKIAAGEVIERPASVVKEMVENSIDAGADKITVEIKNGGISYIKVTDNGKGIAEDDLEMAFERHATSKIRSAEDLNTVTSMGFRGEALASIVAVANVEIISKPKEQPAGYKVLVSGGNLLGKQEIGCPTGTSITVTDLFFNTPVRYKFLKKDYTETGYIEDVMTRIALVNPNIAFKLVNSGKTIIQTNGNGKIEDVIYSIYGKDIAQGVLPVVYEYEGIKVKGLIGKPEIARSNRSNQLFFVNKRYIKDKTLSAATTQGYKGLIPIGKFGFVILNLEIDPNKVDVNVHPAKLEVRFEEENKVFQAIYHGIKDTLLKADLIKNTSKETSKTTNPSEIQRQMTRREKSFEERLAEKMKEKEQEKSKGGLFGHSRQSKKIEEYTEEESRIKTNNIVEELYKSKQDNNKEKVLQENSTKYETKDDVLQELKKMKDEIEEGIKSDEEEIKIMSLDERQKEIDEIDNMEFTEEQRAQLDEKVASFLGKAEKIKEKNDKIISGDYKPEEIQQIEKEIQEVDKQKELENTNKTIDENGKIEESETETNKDEKTEENEVETSKNETIEETIEIKQEIEENPNNNEEKIQEYDEDALPKALLKSKKEKEETLEKINNQITQLEENPQEITEEFKEMYAKLFGTVPKTEEEIKQEEEEKIRQEKVNAIDIVKDNISMFENEEEYQLPTYKFIGIAFDTYIILEMDKELYIIDQHAAHERIMYEKVKKNYYSDTTKDSQMLLLPDVITLTHKEMDIAKENMDMFKKAGFELEEFGENTLKLTGCPTLCLDLDTKELFLETLDEINTVARTAKQEKEEKFIATVACKAAVKANMALDEKEVNALMDKLLRLPNPFTCPHGRPTAIKMTKYDIERKFARK